MSMFIFIHLFIMTELRTVLYLYCKHNCSPNLSLLLSLYLCSFYRCVYNLLKQFDQEKQKIDSIDDIFDARIETLRSSIVDQSTALIYQTEFEVIGRKCREILWFKGYYDLISLAKRLWKKNQGGGNNKRAEDQISNLIIEGIGHFKLLIVNLERKFSLELRDVVDFSFLDTYEKNLYTAVANQNGISRNENRSQDEVTKYAMETIHSLLISLGDLHRYFIDFDFAMPKIDKVNKCSFLKPIKYIKILFFFSQF